MTVLWSFWLKNALILPAFSSSLLLTHFAKYFASKINGSLECRNSICPSNHHWLLTKHYFKASLTFPKEVLTCIHKCIQCLYTYVQIHIHIVPFMHHACTYSFSAKLISNSTPHWTAYQISKKDHLKTHKVQQNMTIFILPWWWWPLHHSLTSTDTSKQLIG